MLYEIRQFDNIKLKTTKNIKYVSAPPGTMPDPQGTWSVVGNMGKELLICKESALCKVPISDVYIAGRSMIDHYASELINGKKEETRSEGSGVREPGGDDGGD